MLFGATRFVMNGWVDDLYIQPSFYFTYYGFDWVKPLDGLWMYLPFFLMIITSIGIILGAFYRLSAILFFVSFTYIELIDKTNYLNHYYFVSLIALLLIFIPCNADFSLDIKWKLKKQQLTVPQWNLRILQFQIACVYVFAGIAKLESDWLFEAQPLKTWLNAHQSMPIFGSLLAKEWVAYAFSWFGCIYDLFIVFFLSTPRFRKPAYFFVVAFHFITWYLFPIGVFPWVMMGLTPILFSICFHNELLDRLKKWFKWQRKSEDEKPISYSKLTYSLLIIYVFLQLAIPFRYLAYPGNLFWNEEGFRFSWRVMLMHKQGNATFFITDRGTNKSIEIINTDYLTERQVDQMSTQPDMILQFAHHLENKFSDTTFHFGTQHISLKNPSVHASVFISLNGRRSQEFIAKKHDLTEIQYNLNHRNWLEPYKK